MLQVQPKAAMVGRAAASVEVIERLPGAIRVPHKSALSEPHPLPSQFRLYTKCDMRRHDLDHRQCLEVHGQRLLFDRRPRTGSAAWQTSLGAYNTASVDRDYFLRGRHTHVAFPADKIPSLGQSCDRISSRARPGQPHRNDKPAVSFYNFGVFLPIQMDVPFAIHRAPRELPCVPPSKFEGPLPVR